MEDLNLSIAGDFSWTPGPRYIEEGDYSGQEFREKILLGLVKEAIKNNYRLVVNLDGTAGYGTSFLEEAFGGLIRVDEVTYDAIKQHLFIISEEEPFLKEDIEEYLNDANNVKQKK